MEDKCVCCGAIIPEGRQVCELCEKGNRKFTDDEVIKALECCVCGCCIAKGCPLFDENDDDDIGKCTSELSKNALALINRQKAEIERLNGCVKTEEEVRPIAKAVIDAGVAIAKAEAYKEFAERLKFRVYNRYFSILIDNLAKEMTEGGAE